MSYKLGLPYQLSTAFYFDTMIAHYEELNRTATTQSQFKFINDRLIELQHSLQSILN